MTEQKEKNIVEQIVTSPEKFLTASPFTFDGEEDHRIDFELIRPRKDRPNQDYVVITVSYPFDRDTYEDVYESLIMPHAEFGRLVEEINQGVNHATFSDENIRFELQRTESDRISFRFANESYQLHAPCVIDGLSL